MRKILGILTFLTILAFVYFVPPETEFAVPAFFVLLFVLIFAWGTALYNHTRRITLISIGVVGLLVLRYLGVGTILNSILLVMALALFEFYFTKTQ